MVYYPSMSGVVTLDGVAANMGSRWRPDILEESARRYFPSKAAEGAGCIDTFPSLPCVSCCGPCSGRRRTRQHEIDEADLPWWQVFRRSAFPSSGPSGFWT